MSCFFKDSSIYKDAIFDVRFDKSSNSTEIVFIKPSKTFVSKFLTITKNRLAIDLVNNQNKHFLLNIQFDPPTFNIKSEDYEDTGVCEEKSS